MGKANAKGKGGKNKRRGKNDSEENKRELVFKEHGQEYAQVVRMLGNGRLEGFWLLLRRDHPPLQDQRQD